MAYDDREIDAFRVARGPSDMGRFILCTKMVQQGGIREHLVGDRGGLKTHLNYHSFVSKVLAYSYLQLDK